MIWTIGSSFVGLLLGNPFSSLISIVTLLLASVIAKVFYTRDSRFLELKKLIPGPPQLPLFGNTFELLGSPSEILRTLSKWTEDYGPRSLYRIGNYWIVSIAESKDMEKLLSSTTETHKSVDYDQLIPWLGEGLLTSNGKRWSYRRKLLTSAFHFKILEQFLETFNEQSKLLATILQDEFSGKEMFNIAPFLTRCTLEIICETAMGVKINAQMNRHSEYISALERVKELQLYRGMRPWLEPRIVWDLFSHGFEEKRCIKILHYFTNKVIRERKTQFLENADKLKATNTDVSNAEEDSYTSTKPAKGRLALLDLMFEVQQTSEIFTDEGIREETDTFMFGGHDTTSTAAGLTIFHLGNNLDAQKKLHAELDQVFGNDTDRPVTSEDLVKLKYLECCIKESMRLTAPVPITARSLQNDFELEDGLILPKDTLLMLFPFQLHRDPKVFPDPLIYRPERFLQENAVGRHPFSYLPFSGGSRNCIGQKFAMMEEKILLSNIFRRFEIHSCEKLEDLVLEANIVLHSKNGIKVKVISR